MTWWLHGLYQDWGALAVVSWAFWVLFSITFHELAHGWAAVRMGDRTPIDRKRMTWNPIVHMGTASLIAFALIGIAWGVMPVNPSRFKNRKWGDVLVALAGPGANLVLVVITTGLARVLGATDVLSGTALASAQLFLWSGAFLNLVLAVFNMIPVPPLDGSRVLARLFPPARAFYAKPEAAMFGLALFLAVFFMTDFGGLLFGYAQTGAASLAGIDLYEMFHALGRV